MLLSSTPAYALFFDVTWDHPYAKAIDYLTKQGIVEGYENRSFRPEHAVTRAEFSKIVVGMVFPKSVIDICIDDADEEDLVIPQMKFPDVPDDAWFAPYVCTAWRHGIIDGYPDGSFRPEEGVNFAESAKMLSLSFGLTGIELPNLGSSVANAEWYRPYAEFLSLAGAIPPTLKRYIQPVNRGELAEMLYRLKDFSLGMEPIATFDRKSDELDEVITWKTYKNKPYGFTLSMPNIWPEPHAIPRGTFDGRIPYTRSLWTVYIGPETATCNAYNSCVEREMWMDGYDVKSTDAILSAVDTDEFSVEILDQGITNELPTLSVYEKVGTCTDKRVFFFGKKYIYVLNAVCGAQNPKVDRMIDRLVQGFHEITIPSLEY